MNQVYEFNDWTSASRMINEKDPCLVIDVGVILNEQNIEGYCLTIINQKVDDIVYRFYVTAPNYDWSLTTEEAIDVLNKIGFPCRFIYPEELSEETRRYLEALIVIGFTQIERKSSGEYWAYIPDRYYKDVVNMEMLYPTNHIARELIDKVPLDGPIPIRGLLG